MNTRKLARSAQRSIIIGTAQSDPNYGILGGVKSPEEFTGVVNYANQLGFRFLDTASSYLLSEQLIGKSIWKGNIDTKIATGASPTESLAASLQRLRRGSVRTVYLHDPRPSKIPETFLMELRDQKAEQKATRIGASVYEIGELLFCLESKYIDVIQVPISVADQRFSQVVESPPSTTKEVVARSTLLQGLLMPSANGRFRPPEIESVAEITQRIASDIGVSQLELLLSFPLMFPGVNQIVIGVQDKKQLLELAQAEIINLDSGILEDIKKVAIADPNIVDPRFWRL